MLTINDISWSDKKRFWAKVDVRGPDECWLWTAAKVTNGYGSTWAAGRQHRAHRVSVILSGRNLDDVMCVLHKCDVKACVNPTHLFTGTQAENMLDKTIKGRSSKGVGRWSAKLDDLKVMKILSLKGTASQREIGRRFGVCQHAIWSIFIGKKWTHVTKIERKK